MPAEKLNVVITGSSKGIGKAIGETFAAAGHNLFLCARDEKLLAEVRNTIALQFPGIEVYGYAADLSVQSDAALLAKEIESKFAKTDILINNAGQFLPGSIHNEEEGTMDKMLQANLFSAYYITRALLPKMITHKQGHIFNMCSIASLKAYDNGGSYSVTKFALMGFSKNLREELKPFNIKVTTVYPGAVYTSSWDGSGVAPERILEVNDIAQMILAASGLSPQACVEEIIIRPVLGDL